MSTVPPDWAGRSEELRMLALPFKCATLQFDSGYSPGLIDTLDFDTLRTQLDSGVQNDATNAFVPKRT